MAKNRSKTKKIPFDLTADYLFEIWNEQEGCCSISGIAFDLRKPPENNTVRWNAPSLDRIIPTEGYVKGNVRFVCYQVNTALNEYGLDQFLFLCRAVDKNLNKGIG